MTAATGIKSNCNVMPNPGMSPVLRKNIVMASQFRSEWKFFLRRRIFNLNSFPSRQRRVQGNAAAFVLIRGLRVSTPNRLPPRLTSKPAASCDATVTAVTPPPLLQASNPTATSPTRSRRVAKANRICLTRTLTAQRRSPARRWSPSTSSARNTKRTAANMCPTPRTSMPTVMTMQH